MAQVSGVLSFCCVRIYLISFFYFLLYLIHGLFEDLLHDFLEYKIFAAQQYERLHYLCNLLLSEQFRLRKTKI